MNYGIEFEFFVKRAGKLVTAREVTYETDGNPLIGEIRTGVFTSITECVFDLKLRIFNMQQQLAKKKCQMFVTHSVKLSDEDIKQLRAKYGFESKDPMELLSIYPDNNTGKILPANIFKASLQVSLNESYTEQFDVKSLHGRQTVPVTRAIGNVFNYIEPIAAMDKVFAADLKKADREKGVYCIKSGDKGYRIEYRSLPNTIDPLKLIPIFNK